LGLLINIIFRYFLLILLGIQSAVASGSLFESINEGSLVCDSEISLKEESDSLCPKTKIDSFSTLRECIELDESIDDELPHCKLPSIATCAIIPLSDYNRCYLSTDQYLQLPLYTLFCQWRFDSILLT